jgi:hypothetical protein
MRFEIAENVSLLLHVHGPETTPRGAGPGGALRSV